MISPLHAKTTLKTIASLKMPNGVGVAELAFGLLNENQQLEWVGWFEDIIDCVEDINEVNPLQVSNVEYLLEKLNIDAETPFFPWDVRELNKIYIKHLSKLSQENLSRGDFYLIRYKVDKKIKAINGIGLIDQLGFLMVDTFDHELPLDKKYESFFLAKRKVAVLDVYELNHAINSIIRDLDASTPHGALLIDYFKIIKKLILFYLAKINHCEIAINSSYWAVSQIKTLSSIKMYFIDSETGKKNFFTNGFRQDKLDSLLSKILSSFDLSEIQKISIDEKIDHLYTAIESSLKLSDDIDNIPVSLTQPHANSKYIALIILDEIGVHLNSSKVKWADDYQLLLEQLLFKYTHSSNDRSAAIDKYYDPLSTPQLNHKYIDGCIECVELH